MVLQLRYVTNPLCIILDVCFTEGLMNRKSKEISSATTSQDYQIISSSMLSDLLKTTGPKRKTLQLWTSPSRESICPSVSTPSRKRSVVPLTHSSNIHASLVSDDPTVEKLGSQYDLLANISEEGTATSATYKIHVRNRASDQWFQIQDLRVEEILPQMIFLSESYIQIWERRKAPVKGKGKAEWSKINETSKIK